MDIVDEMEYEHLEPVCDNCGKRLTKEEWEIDSNLCNICFESLNK